MLLSEDQKKIGAIAASAGNHALGLSLHGKQLGIPVTVVMPTIAPITKVQRCRDLGAEVIVAGSNIAESREIALERFPEKEYINGFDDAAIIAGQVGLFPR